MKHNKNKFSNLSLGQNVLHVLETHEVIMELLVPKLAFPHYGMREEQFYEAIENGTVLSWIVDGITFVPIFAVDPDYCNVCGRLNCKCDKQDDDPEPQKLPFE